MSERFEHIVVGAGISGLGLAHWAARRGVQTLVLDAGERIGGCINTRVFPGCGDFWVEGGSHTCFNSYGHLLDILGDVGLLNRLTPKAKLRYSLWRGGRRHSVFSALHPLELAISLPRLFTTQKAGRSVRDFYAAGLGAANYRDLFGPAFRAVICQEADDFPADLLFRRKPRRKEFMRSFTLRGGLSEIPLAIAGQNGLEVRTGLSLAEVRGDGDGFRLVLGNGDELACATLTLAVPPDVAAGLLGSVLDKEAVAHLVDRRQDSKVPQHLLRVRHRDGILVFTAGQALGRPLDGQEGPVALHAHPHRHLRAVSQVTLQDAGLRLYLATPGIAHDQKFSFDFNCHG